MTIGSISSLLPLQAAPSTPGVAGAASAGASGPAAVDAPSSGGSASISRFGELLGRLRELARQDPSKFQAVTAQASHELQIAAGRASGDKAQALRELATGLAHASSTGDLTALHQSAGGATHGRRHHHVDPVVPAASGSLPGRADAEVAQVSEQVVQALGMSTAPLGPWLPRGG
jgi:hypothetical protein